MPRGFQIPGQAYDPYTGEPLNPDEQEAYSRLVQRQSAGFSIPVQEEGPVGPQGPVEQEPSFSLPPGVITAGRPRTGPTVGDFLSGVGRAAADATMDRFSPERYLNRLGNTVSSIASGGPWARAQEYDPDEGVGTQFGEAIESIPVVGEVGRRALNIAGAPGASTMGAANLALTAGGGIAARNIAEAAGLGETGQMIADIAGSAAAPVAGNLYASAVRSGKNIPVGMSIKDVGPDGQSPYESVRREIVSKINQERALEDQIAQEIKKNQTSATARYKAVFDLLRSKGATVEQANLQARRSLAGRQRETFIGGIEITDDARAVMMEQIEGAGLKQYEQTKAIEAFGKLIDGLGTNKSQRTLLSRVFGDDIVEGLHNRTAAVKRSELNNLIESELFQKTAIKPPRGVAPGAASNKANFGPARHAAKTESERIKNAAMSAKAAEKEAAMDAAQRARSAAARGEQFRARNEASQKLEAQRILASKTARERAAIEQARAATERVQQQAKARADAAFRRGEEFRKRNAKATPVTRAVKTPPVEPLRPSTTWEKILDYANIPRTTASGFDFGYAFRQGGVLSARNPKEFYSSFQPALRAGVNREYSQAFVQDMLTGKNSQYYKKAGLHIIDPEGVMSMRDEAMASQIAQKIPGIGASARVHAHGLNYIRRGFMDKNIDRLIAAGKTGKEFDDALVELGRFTNWATGRGDLPWATTQGAADAMNALFFSPRLLTSRFQTIKATLPKGMGGLQDDLVRQIARENVAAWFVQNASVLTLLSMTGVATVSLDPRSSDFGQIQIGDTRIDPWAGMRPIAVALARVAGRVTEAGMNSAGIDYTLPGEPREDTIGRLLVSFAEGKFSPGAGLAKDVLFEETYDGDEIDSPSDLALAAFKRSAPLIAQDLWEALQIYGPQGIALAAPALVGLGTNTYQQGVGIGGSFGGSFGGGSFGGSFGAR